MKVITSNPIIVSRQAFVSDAYSNADDDTKKAAIGAGLAAAGGLVAALASKPKTLTEIEQRCGKKPKFGAAKKAAWQDCVNKANAPVVQDTQPEAKDSNKKKKIAIIVGSLLLVVIIAYVVIKNKNSNSKK